MRVVEKAGKKTSKSVMAGLVPAIHAWQWCSKKDVDGRNKSGHDTFKHPWRCPRGGGTHNLWQSSPSGMTELELLNPI